MYYIVFTDNREREIYSGGTYVHQGEKYACFDSANPKLYKSEKTAERVALNLIRTCTNTGTDFEIVKETIKK